MKTIFVKFGKKGPLLLHNHLGAKEWWTLSVPEKNCEEVFEVPETDFVRGKIGEGLLREVSKPANYNKLGDKPADLTFITLDQDEKLRLATEKTARLKERKGDKPDAK